MLTDRTQALLAAIEHQVEAGQAALEAEKERYKALEAENRALKERLLALAELDPLMVKGHDHNEDPDGGTRARGLGNLAFRRPRPKLDETPAGRSSQTISPLQRLTSSSSGTPGEPPAAHHPETRLTERAEIEGDAHPTIEEGTLAFESRPPEEPGDFAPSMPDAGQPQNSLAFGAEHEAPSPHSLLAQWYKRYPKTFFKGHTRPLKTGIHLELCEVEPWPEKLVRRALACYVHLPRYLKSVREDARRVGMDGEDCEAVTAEEAKHAKRQLEALQKKQKTRETQQRSEKLDRKIGALLAKHGQQPQE
ncbi:ProQ/FINO family protein [Salinicola sp. CPA57]|uniref:ProQ/FINO family protein n=1 Tax=Salinicola sp. CPA57 TaxID=1949080 RepID=UPI001E5DBD6D|nr:ProQ/FINO family protein [Salinicola sp. CPA57]